MITVIDVLKVLERGENYLIKINNYNKISNEVKDVFNVYENNETIPTRFKMNGHDSRMNISIYEKSTGYVKLNPRQAERVGLPYTIKTNPIVKSKVIIRDGELNCSNFDLIVDFNTYMTLKEFHIDFKKIDNNTNISGIAINLELNGLDIVDNKLYQPSLDDILNNCKKLNILKVKQKVLNALLSEYGEFKNDEFTSEQLQILEDHGLNSSLQYVGVKNEIQQTNNEYTGKIVTFKTSGSSSSTFKVLMERVRDGKKLNELDTIQYEYYQELQNKMIVLGLIDVEKKFLLNENLNSIKNEIKKIKLNNTIYKMLIAKTTSSEIAVDAATPYKHNELTIEIKDQIFTK